MTGIELKITDEQLHAAVGASILATLTDDMREHVLKQAIAYLITPPNNNYGRSESPLQMAFNNAVSGIAHQMARDYVAENPEFQAAIKLEMERIAAKLIESREDFRELVAEAVVARIRVEDR